MTDPTEVWRHTVFLDKPEKVFTREFSVRVVNSNGGLRLQQRMRDSDDILKWVDIPVVPEDSIYAK